MACVLSLLGFGECPYVPPHSGDHGWTPRALGREPDDTQYNIVLIVSDDQSYDHFGFAGHPIIETPSLDELAAESVRFPNTYVSSFCRPTLATLLTGLPPHVHGVTYTRGELLGDFVTLADRLADAGYETYQAGKFWEGLPSRRGFSDFTRFTSLQGNLEIGRTSIDPIFEFMDDADRPWFVWFSPLMPHVPHDALEEYRDIYEGRGLNAGTVGYYAMISWFDDVVGELLDGIDDDTVVIFMADNGYSPLNDPPAKSTSYERGIRTQLLIRHPNRTGEVRSLPIDAIDVPATILAIAGADHSDLPGQDLLDNPRPRSLFGSNHPFLGPAPPTERWVRSGNWKLVDYTDGEDALYHLESDPEEQNNLIDIPILNFFEFLLRSQLEHWWSG